MSARNLKTAIPSDYPTLLSRVKTTLVEGQERIEAERVKTYWDPPRPVYIFKWIGGTGETSPKSISSKKHPKEILAGAYGGQAAKAFVQSHIKEAQKIIVRSSRSDKYDRYLADVFIPPPEQENRGAAGIYLNNLLLDNDYAVRMEQ